MQRMRRIQHSDSSNTWLAHCLNPRSHLPLLDLGGEEGNEVNPWGNHHENFLGVRLSTFHHDRMCSFHSDRCCKHPHDTDGDTDRSQT